MLPDGFKRAIPRYNKGIFIAESPSFCLLIAYFFRRETLFARFGVFLFEFLRLVLFLFVLFRLLTFVFVFILFFDCFLICFFVLFFLFVRLLVFWFFLIFFFRTFDVTDVFLFFFFSPSTFSTFIVDFRSSLFFTDSSLLTGSKRGTRGAALMLCENPWNGSTIGPNRIFPLRIESKLERTQIKDEPRSRFLKFLNFKSVISIEEPSFQESSGNIVHFLTGKKK